MGRARVLATLLKANRELTLNAPRVLLSPLTDRRLAKAAVFLAGMDKDLAKILSQHGVPPLWERASGFATLIRIILEQQVSLASADAMYRRLVDRVVPLTPQSILVAGVPLFRSFGVTRQKAGYFINIAAAIQSGELDLEAVSAAGDKSAMQMLTQIKGVGPWTAEVYLLMALRRPDVWPAGDIALATAVQNLRNLPQRPTATELAKIASAWKPYRATAARMLWLYYLNGMG